jgi:hypothetical protein
MRKVYDERRGLVGAKKDESSGECDWTVSSEVKVPGSGRAVADRRALVLQQSRQAVALKPVDARDYLEDACACSGDIRHG